MTDTNNLAARLVALAKAKNLHICTAESCTGGLLAGAITDIAGASEVFEVGFICYSNAAKIGELGVSKDILTEFGAVSEQVAEAMAIGALSCARKVAKADIAIAITGIAGPGGSDHKPEGRVCFAVAGNAKPHSETREFGALGRDAVRAAAVQHALELLESLITNN